RVVIHPGRKPDQIGIARAGAPADTESALGDVAIVRQRRDTRRRRRLRRETYGFVERDPRSCLAADLARPDLPVIPAAGGHRWGDDARGSRRAGGGGPADKGLVEGQKL